MKQSFQNNINNIFQRGTGSQYSPSREHILALRNNVYYRNSKSGTQSSSSNYVDAIYARSFAQNRYSVMAYNYNASPTSNVSENLRFTMTLPVAGGTRYRVRSGVYNKTNNTFTYSGWTNMTTPGTGKTTSTISFDRTLPVFAFLKYEIETLSSTGKFVNNDQAKALIEDETTFANGKAVVQNISVYPNPTKEYISIEGLTGDNNQISIFDFSGKLILSTNQSKNISTNNFVSGIYFIQINNSDFIKFIKE